MFVGGRIDGLGDRGRPATSIFMKYPPSVLTVQSAAGSLCVCSGCMVSSPCCILICPVFNYTQPLLWLNINMRPKLNLSAPSWQRGKHAHLLQGGLCVCVRACKYVCVKGRGGYSFCLGDGHTGTCRPCLRKTDQCVRRQKLERPQNRETDGETMKEREGQ